MYKRPPFNTARSALDHLAPWASRPVIEASRLYSRLLWYIQPPELVFSHLALLVRDRGLYPVGNGVRIILHDKPRPGIFWPELRRVIALWRGDKRKAATVPSGSWRCSRTATSFASILPSPVLRTSLLGQATGVVINFSKSHPHGARPSGVAPAEVLLAQGSGGRAKTRWRCVG